MNWKSAYQTCTEGRPGPCWLDVPMNIQAAQIAPETLAAYSSEPMPASADLGAAVDQVLELLRNAAADGLCFGLAMGFDSPEPSPKLNRCWRRQMHRH